MEKIENWIEQWINIFPPDNYVVTDGYLKGKSQDCVKKMQKFCKDNPTYTKDVIFAATRMYIVHLKPRNFAYCKRPIYFIHKQTEGSMLGAYCEKVLAGEVQHEVKEYNPVNEFI